jgi:A/G-specific adenine glycosylase
MRGRLLDWYLAHRRDLPWRNTRDPFAIWISESMLQQTRVDTVIPYYERFLERFPDVQTLADSDLEEVYGLWTGLGYYSRARNLHSAAQMVVEDYGGRLPSHAEDLRRLKGVGRYTAGALASIAFDREEPLVDGNVVRVLTRWLGWRADVSKKQVVDQLWEVAGRLVQGPRPGDLNQALMELGATLCTPRGPRCGDCPLKRSCRGRQQGDPESIPSKPRKQRVVPMRGVAAWIERKGRVLAVRRTEGGLLGGMWELPGGTIRSDEDSKKGLRRCLRETLALEVGELEARGQVEHLFSHRKLKLDVYRAHEALGRVRRSGLAEHRWVAPSSMEKLPHGGPTRKALVLLGQAAEGSPRMRIRSQRNH